jgi:hypothetical protein
MAPKPNFVNLSATVADMDADLLNTTEESLIELIREENWIAVKSRIDECPAQVQMLSKGTISGHKVLAYPLHYLLIKKHAPSSLVQEFINLSPTAVSYPDSTFGRLPVHIACQHDADLDVIKALVHQFPQATSTPDKDDNLPLHYACFLSTPEVVLYLLQHTDSKVLSKTNGHQQNVLHMACSRYDISGDSIATLLETCPELASQRDWQHRFPVHDACMWHADTPVVEKLLESYPDAVHGRDAQHLTPYGICRKLVHLNVNHPTIQLLRHYCKKHHNLFARSLDVAQFTSENLGDRLQQHRNNKSAHVR